MRYPRRVGLSKKEGHSPAPRAFAGPFACAHNRAMTPFGARLRELRAQRGVTLKDLAAALQVSAAYLSALEHGRRGRPSAGLVHQVNEYFGLIWDDAEDLARLARQSHPRVVLDTSGLDPAVTDFANRLAREIRQVTPDAAARMAETLDTLRKGRR